MHHSFEGGDSANQDSAGVGSGGNYALLVGVEPDPWVTDGTGTVCIGQPGAAGSGNWLRCDGTTAWRRRHAEVMAERGSAQHGFAGEPSLTTRVKQAGARFSWLSENVTQGPTPRFIHSQLVNSPPHRANILDRDMDSIGVGVVELGGQLFAVEDLSQAR